VTEYESAPHPEYVHDDGVRYSIDDQCVVYAVDGDNPPGTPIGIIGQEDGNWVAYALDGCDVQLRHARRAVLIALIDKASHSR
jgi:hypothetical protein